MTAARQPIGAAVPGPDSLTAEERATFEAVCCAHRAAVMRALRARRVSEEDIADITQEACLRILRYRECRPESLKRLLFRTALNLAVSHRLKACSRRTHVPLEEVDLAMQSPSVDEVLVQDEKMEGAIRAVRDLPVRCREIFVLRLLHGLRQREIAEHCGISTRRVEQHLARAQVLIRQQMGQYAS